MCNPRLKFWLIGELGCILMNLAVSLFLVYTGLRFSDDYLLLIHCGRPVHFAWWLVGFYWVFNTSHACQMEVRPLYRLCSALLFLNFVDFFKSCLVAIIVLPFAFLCIRRLLDFLPRGERGLSTFAISQLESCTYEEGMFDQQEDKVPRSEETTPNDSINDSRRNSLDRSNRKKSENGHCAICRDDYQVGDSIRILPCHVSHHFHRTCLDRWLEFNATCPLCRKPVSGFPGDNV